MNIRIVLWTLCMTVAGFLLVGSTPSITSVTILGLITGAGHRSGARDHVHSQSQTQTYLATALSEFLLRG